MKTLVQLGAACLVLAGGPAMAQAPALPAAAPAAANPNVPNYGPPISGLCVFSRDQALTTSQAGVGVNQQLQTLASNVQGNLNPERDAIAKDNTALAAEKPKLAAAVYEKRAAEIAKRAQTYAQTVQTRNAQFQATRDKAMDQIAQAVTPILVGVISDHHCSLIVERNSIYGANPAMDLTVEVIQKLNAALPTVAISLVPPEAVQGQQPQG